MARDNLILTSIDKEFLAKEIADRAASIIFDKIKKILPEKEKVELTRSQVAERLNRSLPSIDKYTQQGILRRYKRGGRYFYYEHEVDLALIEMENPRFVTGKHNYKRA